MWEPVGVNNHETDAPPHADDKKSHYDVANRVTLGLLVFVGVLYLLLAVS